MSWLARSIANTLRLDDDDADEDDEDPNDVVLVDNINNGGVIKKHQQQNDAAAAAEFLDLEEVDLGDRVGNNDDINKNNRSNDYNYDNAIRNKDSNFEDDGDQNSNNQGRGVKEDLSEFTETLTRQLWGVASFLAPPPPPPPPPPLPRPRSFNWSESDRRRTEVVEMSGSGDGEKEEEEENEMERQFGQFREFPLSFLEVGMPEEEEEDVLADAVGITEEAFDFAENTAHHPETWLNFPLSEEEEFDDFEISDPQFKHARAIEHLAPRLAALRRELCPAHMSEGYFWMVYFVLLHSRLDKHDYDLLSTPQLVKARAMWMHELQKQTKPEPDWPGRDTFGSEENIYFPYENLDPTSCEDRTPRYVSHMAFPLDSTALQVTNDSQPENYPHESREILLIDKSASEEDPKNKIGNESIIGPSHKVPIEEYDEHEDDWLDDDSELEGYTGTAVTLVNEEDVSFSDLEDDFDCTAPIKSKVLKD